MSGALFPWILPVVTTASAPLIVRGPLGQIRPPIQLWIWTPPPIHNSNSYLLGRGYLIGAMKYCREGRQAAGTEASVDWHVKQAGDTCMEPNSEDLN